MTLGWLSSILIVLSLVMPSTKSDRDGPHALLPDQEKSVSCPPQEQLGTACTCWATSFGGLYIECTGVENSSTLAKPFSALSGQPLFGVGLLNSSVTHLPSGILFGGVQALYLRSNRIPSIRGPGPSPFDSVESSLVYLDVDRGEAVWSWRWEDFKPLNRIRQVNVRKSDVRSLDSGLTFGLSPVQILTFSECGISWLSHTALAGLTNLTSLDLSYNSISHLQRSMFPPQSEKLVSVNLRHNMLTSLERGTFDDMPQLQVLDLGSNHIRTLLEESFKPVFQAVRKHVYLAGNPLQCDDLLKWLMKASREDGVTLQRVAAGAVCWMPPELEGRNLTSLSSEELNSWENFV